MGRSKDELPHSRYCNTQKTGVEKRALPEEDFGVRGL